MSNATPDQDYNPFSAPAVAAKANPNHLPNIHLTQYNVVRIGLQMIYYSIVAIVLLVILMIALMTISFQTARGGGPGLGTFGDIAIVLGFFVAGIASFIGFCLCAACPNANEKTLALTSIFCFLLYVGASIFGGFPLAITSGLAGVILAASIQIIGGLASIACSITFCLLLKRIGKNISSQLMEKAAHSAMIWFCVLIGSAVVFGFGVGALATANGPDIPGFELIGFVFAVAFFIVGLGTFFKYLAMLRSGINELKPNKNV